MKPNRTKKAKRFRFHPIKKRVEEDVEEENEPQAFTYKARLGAMMPAVREEVTAFLANLCEVPPELRELDTLRLLVERLNKEQPTVTYNAIFAIKNLVELDRSLMGQLVQLNLLHYLSGVLREMATNSSKDIAKKIVQAVYALLLTLVESVSFQQLQQFDRNDDQFGGYVNYLLAVLRQTTVLDASEPPMQFLKTLAEYTVNLRQLIYQQESLHHSIERVFLTAQGRQQCVACYVLLHVGAALKPTTITEMVNLFNDHVNNSNLQEEYSQNFPMEKPESQVVEEDIEQEEEVEKQAEVEIEVEQPAKQQGIAAATKQQKFMESVQMANVMTQWLLSILEKEEQDSNDDEQQVGSSIGCPVNTGSQALKAQLKADLTSIQGVIRNTQLAFLAALELVDMSWRVVQISFSYLNQERILALAFNTLANILPQPDRNEITDSIIETCLSVILSIWEKLFSNSKSVLPPAFDHLAAIAERVLTTASTDRSKIIVLELIGHRYNPEQRPVTPVENRQLGVLLKSVMLTGDQSNLTLQCQCLDTLFDIYCNEDFDTIFKELDFMAFLEGASSAMKALNKKSKFYRQVQQDLKRFIEYKREQLARQNLL